MGYEFEHDEIMAYVYTEISIRQQPFAGMTQKIFKWEFQPRISSLSNSIGVRQPSEEMRITQDEISFPVFPVFPGVGLLI